MLAPDRPWGPGSILKCLIKTRCGTSAGADCGHPSPRRLHPPTGTRPRRQPGPDLLGLVRSSQSISLVGNNNDLRTIFKPDATANKDADHSKHTLVKELAAGTGSTCPSLPEKRKRGEPEERADGPDFGELLPVIKSEQNHLVGRIVRIPLFRRTKRFIESIMILCAVVAGRRPASSVGERVKPPRTARRRPNRRNGRVAQ